MARKTLSHARWPSREKEETEETSSEEEEEGTEEEEKSEEEPSSEDEDEDQPIKGNETPIPVPKSDDKCESDSESDLDGGSPSGNMLQPVSKPSKAAGKRTHEEAGNSEQSPASKRSGMEEKRSFSTLGGVTRLWSDEDEIAVLHGMIEFREVKGLDPKADMGAFHSFVKGRLMVEFSKDQIRTKINRMKKRFLNALKRSGNDLAPVFSKPHEQMAFELFKKIWGGNSKGSMNFVANVIHEKVTGGDEKEIVRIGKDGEEGDFWSRYPFLSISFDKMVGNFPSLVMSGATMSFIKEKLTLIENTKAKKLDEKWKKLIMEENELKYKMLTLMKEQIEVAFDM